MENGCDRHHFGVYFCWELYGCDAGIVVWVLGSFATKLELFTEKKRDISALFTEKTDFCS